MSSSSPAKKPALSNRVSQLINSFNDQGSHTQGQPSGKAPQGREGKEDSKRYQGQWSFHESPDLHRQSSARIGLGGFLGFSNSESNSRNTKTETRKVDNGHKHRKKSSPSGVSRSTTRAEPKLDHEIPLVSEAGGLQADNARADLKPDSSEAPAAPAMSPAPPAETNSKHKKSSKSKHHRTSSQPTILVQDTDGKSQQDQPRGRKTHKASPSRVQTRSKPKKSQSTTPTRPKTSDGTSPKQSGWSMFGLFTPAPNAPQRSKSQDPGSVRGASHTRKVSGDLRPPQTRHRRNLSAPHPERARIYSRKDSSGHVTIHVSKHENAKHLNDLEKTDWRAGLAHRFVGDLY